MIGMRSLAIVVFVVKYPLGETVHWESLQRVMQHIIFPLHFLSGRYSDKLKMQNCFLDSCENNLQNAPDTSLNDNPNSIVITAQIVFTLFGSFCKLIVMISTSPSPLPVILSPWWTTDPLEFVRLPKNTFSMNFWVSSNNKTEQSTSQRVFHPSPTETIYKASGIGRA